MIHTLWVLDVKAVLRKHSYVIIEVWSILCMNSSTAYSPPNVHFTPSTFAMTGQSYSLTGFPVAHSHSKCYMGSSWWQLTPEWEWHHCGTRREKWQHNLSPLHNWSFESPSYWQLYLPSLHFNDKAAIEGHCGHVMAEVTLSGKWYYPLTMYTVEYCSFLL